MRERFPELHPIIVQLLWNRNLKTQEQVDEFLLPDYGQDLHDPFLFRHMTAVCDRLWDAFTRRQRIVIFGDYDADGITGSAVLMSTFRALAEKIGGDPALIRSYIPHREKEGYGLRPEAVESIARDGCDLIVTVDCGISCAAEIALAKERGMETIVVDHHQVPALVPDCLLIHPLVPGETYPYKYLAAVGVAFKLACGLIRTAEQRGHAFPPGFEKWLLDLVAIATVTDFMPLVGENRTLEKYGLIVLNRTRRPGLKKIIESAGRPGTEIDTVAVGYGIGPRLNAASRMDHARLAFETVMAPDDEAAGRLAEQLNKLNTDRQRYTEEVMRAAHAKLAAEGGNAPIRVVCGDGWSAGIVGLVAGKLVSEMGVPVLVFGREGEHFVGSGRGIPGFDLVAALNAAKAHLARFGGHPQACGVTIEGEDNFSGFRDIIGQYAAGVLAGRDLRPVLEIDAELRLSQVTWELVEQLRQLEPHGEGNQRPRFLLSDLLVGGVDPVGKDGRHVRVRARGDLPREAKLIGFNLRERTAAFLPGSRADAAVEIGINSWNGQQEIQLKIIDIRQAVRTESSLCKA